MSEDRRKLSPVLLSQLQDCSWIYGNPDEPLGRAIFYCASRRNTFYYATAFPEKPLFNANLEMLAETLKTPRIEEAREIESRLWTLRKFEWDIINVTRLCVAYEPARSRKRYLAQLRNAYVGLWESNHRTGENLK